MKSTFKISGMTCNGCKSTVEDKLSLLNGVDEVLVDLAKGEAVIYSKNPISYSLITNKHKKIAIPMLLVFLVSVIVVFNNPLLDESKLWMFLALLGVMGGLLLTLED